MSEKIALYRKYRPQSFSEVLGQEHVVEVLENAVRAGRIAHAYLFAGPRGTGKTSVARILAKEAGCSDIDLMEIDAASSRGIDEIRALRDAVRFSPMGGAVKVYIIDEVHMLTKEAFNALLKTLEEPPKHAIFILATTEMDKVPETIISRCQSFSFRKISDEAMRKSLIGICKKENFEIDDEAIGLLALIAGGSFRDAQGMLDQVLSLFLSEENDKSGKKITGDKLRNFLSFPSEEIVDIFIDSFLAKDTEKGLEAIHQAINGNTDMKIFLKLVLRDIRSMILLKLAPNMKPRLAGAHGEREFRFIEKKAAQAKNGELERALKILLDAYDTRARPFLPQIPLELAFLKIVGHNI